MSERNVIYLLSGGFDPPHVGHLRMIKAVPQTRYNDKLIIGLNSDDWLRRKKGANFMSYAHRCELLEGYNEVDEVVPFDDSDGTAKDLLFKVRARFPEHDIIFCNGGDRTPGHVPEEEFAEELGIEFQYNIGGGKAESSSELVKRYYEQINRES